MARIESLCDALIVFNLARVSNIRLVINDGSFRDVTSYGATDLLSLFIGNLNILFVLRSFLTEFIKLLLLEFVFFPNCFLIQIKALFEF
jgi:hypothetical protein